MALRFAYRNTFRMLFPRLYYKSYNHFDQKTPTSRCMVIGASESRLQALEVEVTFVKANGSRIAVKGRVGDNLLDVVTNNNIDLDGFGACEGTLTCSTCHLIFSKQDFDRLPDKPSDEETDMLDLAYEVTDTSRLGCQIILTKDLEGIQVIVPSTINDART